MTTRCRLLCYYLDCGAEFFEDDLASCRTFSISCGMCESPQQSISGKLLAIGFAATMRHLSNYFDLLLLLVLLGQIVTNDLGLMRWCVVRPPEIRHRKEVTQAYHGFLYHGGHGPTRQCISHLPAFSGNAFAVLRGHLPSRTSALMDICPSIYRTFPPDVCSPDI